LKEAQDAIDRQCSLAIVFVRRVALLGRFAMLGRFQAERPKLELALREVGFYNQLISLFHFARQARCVVSQD
jgi:hypothetical protein